MSCDGSQNMPAHSICVVRTYARDILWDFWHHSKLHCPSEYVGVMSMRASIWIVWFDWSYGKVNFDIFHSVRSYGNRNTIRVHIWCIYIYIYIYRTKDKKKIIIIEDTNVCPTNEFYPPFCGRCCQDTFGSDKLITNIAHLKHIRCRWIVISSLLLISSFQYE